MKLVVNLPPIQSYVRNEYLYDHQSSYPEGYSECYWVTAKSIQYRAFLIESFICENGALFDKIPISGYVWKTDINPKTLLPLEDLQMWDCLSYDISFIHKTFLTAKNCIVHLSNNRQLTGQYMFTIDPYGNDTLAETPNEHKSYNFIKLENGQYCCYPNNRLQFLDRSFTPNNPPLPKWKTCTHTYYAEEGNHESLSTSTEYFYGDS